MKSDHASKSYAIALIFILILQMTLSGKINAQWCGRSFPHSGAQGGAYASGGDAQYVPGGEWCPGNIIRNGEFTDSLVAGAMPTGKTAGWTQAYGSPDVNPAAACQDTGSIQMWGNLTLGEAIYQKLAYGNTVAKAHLYEIDLCYKWHQPVITRPYPVAFMVRASNVPLTSATDPRGTLVGTTPPTYSLSWISASMTWLADSDYSYITISPVNQSHSTHGDSISFGYVDGVCLKEIFPITPQTNISSGWNIISVPVIVDDYRAANIYPTAVSSAFSYEGYYVTKTILENGPGYWLKFPSPQSVTIHGYGIDSLTIPVNEGWNMIGSPSTNFPAASITSNPPGITASQIFGYDGTYGRMDTLIPGKGYWVKVSGPGFLIMSGGSSFESSAGRTIRIVPTDELPPPPPDGYATAVRDGLPEKYMLEQAYPNPFNPSTVVKYGLPEKSYVTISIHNTLGQKVTTLVDEIEDAGYHEIVFDGSNLSSGVYFYRLQANTVGRDSRPCYVQTKKILLLK